MTIIIHGATGAQGAPVVAALLAHDQSPTAAVRDASQYDGPAEAVSVDFNSVESLVLAYTGADAVFVHLPIGSPEQQFEHARVIVEAVRLAQPSRVVVSTSGYPVDAPDGETPVGSLLSGLLGTGVSLAVVAPKLYLENLLLPPVTAGVHGEDTLRYPLLADYAVSWSSHLDVADVASKLLLDHSITGVVGVGALPGLLGQDLAAGFSSHLGTDVVFEAQTPDAFGASIIPLFGEAGATPVVDSYRWRATQSSELIDQETSAQARLGVEPRTVAEWLKAVSA